MKSNHFHTLLLKIRLMAFAGAVLLLGSCRPATKGGLPVCSGVDLGQAEALRPGATSGEWGIVVDTLRPTLEWSFTDSTCDPEYFLLALDHNWSPMETEGGTPLYEIRIPGTYRSWVPPAPLTEGSVYIWEISARVGEIPYSTDAALFRTGPECVVISPGTMSAPILLYPPDRSVVSVRRPLLEWRDPTGCLPPGDYRVQISETASFDSPIMEYAVDGNGWYMETEVPEDCTTYYWRVKIDLRDRIDSEDGPWSATWSFRTNFTGTCPLDPIRDITPIPPFDFPIPGGLPGGGGGTAEPSSFIDGHVWHDLCAVPYESTDVAPPGCVWVDDIHGYWANGTLDPGEPGLEGVTVDLGAGACPSTGLATDVTDASGRYSFGPLAAGTYCVSINPLSEANVSVLIPGSFTFPVRFAEVGEHTVTLGEADIRRENNFGWDYQFLPAPTSGAPTAKLLNNANCRRGPNVGFDSITVMFQGLTVPIDGRNADSSWWWVRIPNSANHCWLAKENVETSGDLSKVPIVESEALGCWVWTGNKNECKSPCPEGADPQNACEP